MALADIPFHIAALALLNGLAAGFGFLFVAILALFLVTSKACHDGEQAR